MAKDLLEDEILKPVSISLNLGVLEEFDKIAGPDQRSKVIRKLIREYIKRSKTWKEGISGCSEKA